MSEQRAVLLVVGDAVAPTGFARVLHSILDRLEHRYEIHHLGINYRGDPHDARWRIYPAGVDGDLFGVNRLAPLVERVKPRLVFAVYDLWILTRFAVALQPFRESVRSVMYFPVDGGPIQPSVPKDLRAIDRLVAYNRFGAGALKAALAQARAEDPALPDREIDIIPHGVDTKTFYPLAEQETPGGRIAGRLAAKRALFPDAAEFHDSFVVLNANRNQPRKRIDVTMEGFALFARGKPRNVKLYLHMGTEDAGWNLFTLARRFDIEERLILSSREPGQPCETQQRMNLIYNACEIGLNTSSGEGWGLPSFEHAATGAAQIVPRHTACAELWEGAAEMLEPCLRITNDRILTEAHLVSPQAVAGALERLYQDPERRAALAAAAYRNVTQPQYDWGSIALRWDELFQEVLAAR
jgi:D-inositol-3-phosphate glycosyltransferase